MVRSVVETSYRYFDIQLEDNVVVINESEHKLQLRQGALSALRLLSQPENEVNYKLGENFPNNLTSIKAIAQCIFANYMKKLGCWRYVNIVRCWFGRGDKTIEPAIKEMKACCQKIGKLTEILVPAIEMQNNIEKGIEAQPSSPNRGKQEVPEMKSPSQILFMIPFSEKQSCKPPKSDEELKKLEIDLQQRANGCWADFGFNAEKYIQIVKVKDPTRRITIEFSPTKYKSPSKQLKKEEDQSGEEKPLIRKEKTKVQEIVEKLEEKVKKKD